MGVLAGTDRMETLARVVADPLTPDVIAQRVAEGETLPDICTAWNVPYGQLARWLRADEARWTAYEEALAIWADAEAQRCISIADEADTGLGPVGVAHAKLQIETRLRLAEKWNRRQYGTKLEEGGGDGLTIVIQQLDGSRLPVEAVSYAQPKFQSGEVARTAPEDISYIDKPCDG